MTVPAIRTARLTKDYGAGRGVFDLEFQVRAGESFGLLGDEGAGKSTTIRVLMGLIRPTRGSAYIFGLDCAREAVEVKRRVGCVPERAQDFGSLRGGEVVAYIAGLRGGVHQERVRELAERLDLDLGRPHHEYSAQESQKLSIVLAFMHEPDLLILDEPGRHISAGVTASLLSLLDEARGRGAAILLASRAHSEVEACCDAVGMLRRGRLTHVARVEDLRAQLEESSRKALPP